MKVNFLKKISLPKISGIVWSPDNKKLAVAQEDKKIFLFDEQGNNNKIDLSEKELKTEKYEILHILFNPENTKLAIARSDNRIVVYVFDSNFGELKSISNTFELDAKPQCMIWSKASTKEIIIGSINGEIKICLLDDNNTINNLYFYQASCISLSSSLEGKNIISGHNESSIMIYKRETSETKLFVKHSCVPTCLAWGRGSNIVAAGIDCKVVIYKITGEILEIFDYSKDNVLKKFNCFDIRNSGDAIALGNTNTFYIFLYNEINNQWENAIFKTQINFIVTFICWKPDRSGLIIGSSKNGLYLYDTYLWKKNIEIFELSFINYNTLKITNKENQRYMILKPKDSSKILSVEFSRENYFVLAKEETLILVDLNQGIYSEIPWKRTETDKYINDYIFICIVCNNEGLNLIEYGKNEILFTLTTKAYTEEDIEKIKFKYYEYLISTNQLDKASKFKELVRDFKAEIESYMKDNNYIKAINLFLEIYDQNNYDEKILDKINNDLNQSKQFEILGDLLEKMGLYKNAIKAYIEAKCFLKADEIAKKYNLDELNKLNEDSGTYLFNQKDLENAFDNFMKEGELEKAMEALILLNKWEEALNLIDQIPNVNPLFFIKIGEHFEKESQFDRAKEFYIKGGEPMLVFNLCVNFFYKNKKDDSNPTLEQLEKYKKFFEEIEQTKKSSQENKKHFKEEDKKLIDEKIIELKDFLFNEKSDNEIIKEQKDKTDTQENQNIEGIYNKVIEGNITNKNELDDETLFALIEHGKSVEEIEKILKLCKNFHQLLKFIFSKFDYILKKYQQEKKYMHIDEIIDIETNSLEVIKVFHELLLEVEKENNYYLIRFGKIFMKHIDYFKDRDRDIPNLILLKEMINLHENYGDKLDMLSINTINDTIKNSVLNLIKKQCLSSRELIDIILDDNVGLELFKNQENYIFDSINIYDLEENDYPQFCKLWRLIKDDDNTKNLLLNKIFNKVEIFKDFGIIYKLVPDYVFNQSNAKILEDKIKNLLYYNYNIKICTNFLNDICKTIEIFVANNYSLKSFLKFIEENRNIEENTISELYLKILQDLKLNSKEELINLGLKFLVEKKMIKDINFFNTIAEIIIKYQHLINAFLISIEKKYTIYEKDFFETNSFDKFRLYINIYEKFYNHLDCSYFKKSNNSLTNIYNKLIKMDLSYEEFNKLKEQIDKDYFQEKLITFCLLQSQPDHNSKIYDLLKENIKTYQNSIQKLEKLEMFLKAFFYQEKGLLNEIKIQKKKLKKCPIYVNLKNLEIMLSKTNKYEKYINFFNLVDSRFFMVLYFHNKKQINLENQVDLFNKTLQDFWNLIILINIDENIIIDKIPFKDMIIKEIKKIIEESKNLKKNREQNCLKIIKKELDILNEMKLKQIQPQFNNINLYNMKQISFDYLTGEKKLIYLSYSEKIKNVIDSLILLIDISKVNKTNFYRGLFKLKTEIENKNNICLRDIINYINFLQQLQGFEMDITSFESENNNAFFEFLNILIDNEEGIKFLIGKSIDEIRILSEFIGEKENSKIQMNDIHDLIKISNFFENINALISDNNTEIELIEEFKTAFIMTPSFFNSFSNYFDKFKEIQNIYEEYLDRPELSRNKIEQILKYSIIDIKFNTKKRLIEIDGTYKDLRSQEKPFDYNDLQELNDRALLFCNQSFDNFAKDTVENIEDKKKNFLIFISIFENIDQLIKYLNSLYIKGYPYSWKITLQIKNNIAKSKGKVLNILLEDYKRLNEDLEIAQTKAYSQKGLIRLIYGNQFYDIYNYLFYKKGDIMPLLQRLSNNKIKNILNNYIKDSCDNSYFDDNEKKFDSMIEKINYFLSQCLKFNKINIKEIYKENLIKEEFHNKLNKGFYIWTENMKLDINIVKVYKTITGNFPIPITVLLCTMDTNEEEITSFVYRTILCEFRVLFIIMNSDNLELSKAQYLLWILESLYLKYKEKINSTLLITFTDNNSALRKELTKIKDHKYFIPTGYISNNKNKNNFNKNLIEVWSSDATGVGKSTQICLEAKKNNKIYIYFPIGGVTSRKDIIERITELKIDKKNLNKNYLHIDIYDSDDETSSIIREFLFSLLITRSYSYNGKIFFLDQGIKTVIEIPIGFYDMKDKFVLLDYFPAKKNFLEKLPDLIDLDDKNDNNNLTDIQLITNILLMLENNTIEKNVFDLDKRYKKIPINQCQTIINKYFTLPKGNYYQKNAFIHILADQFKKFCSSEYLNPQVLLQNERAKKKYNYSNITDIRRIMIENLIKLTLHFIKGPFTNMILNQKNVKEQIFGEFSEKKIHEIANKYLSNAEEDRVSFEKINPSLVFFNEDVQTFSIITTSKKGEEEYEQLLRLYNSQNDKKREIPLINYRNLSHEELLLEMINVLNLNELSIDNIKKIVGSYCFTSDNFIKMILILLKIRAGIPIIMMGETGCGKTSLIKMLSALLNRGKMNLKILNLHAGIKDKDIIDFIEKVNDDLEKNEKPNNYSDKTWVFFDEINTCNSMGLISEIFYYHSYYGKKLNDKLTFIAACNPYRLRQINRLDPDENDFCLTSKDKKFTYNPKHNLIYLVNPLPHSLLTSIFDFGHLSSEDEKKYIKNIVKETLKEYYTNEKIEELFVKEIVECQNFVRENNGISSISLRDLRRFNLLFDFFMKYLKQNNDSNDYEENQFLINAMCLSLYFCYYIRLSNNKLRKEIITRINKKLGNITSFEQVTQKEKNFVISKMKLPPEIAKNSTLKENIFTLFVCIVNKIPLIMCGKPGTSKSLSFQILYDSMKGKRSDNDFLKKYPEILIFSYQGSKTSTSEGVQKVFNKVKNFSIKEEKKNENIAPQNEIIDKSYNNYEKKGTNFNNQINNVFNKNNLTNSVNENSIYEEQSREEQKINDENINKAIIPVVYFDEMGLAEESPHNPLKVIHSELEYDDREQDYGFVGISNWKLDASKMNRVIFLGVPNLEESDLQETADEIVKNIDAKIGIKYKELFSNLVKTYWNYKIFTRKKNQSEFHGLRDFYHLIKDVMFYLSDMNKENNEEELNLEEKSYQIGIKCLYRNFDGLKEPFNSYEEIKKIFNTFYPNYTPKPPNVFDCLKDNINDKNSRFLLIITKSSMSIHLLKDIMYKLQRKYIFYNGSQLSEDINQEKYNEKLLNKIQLSLENGDVLVLRNMENIYPSLYNLFNQNFTTLGKKRFARIAFANYNIYSEVHENFRAIVLVDEKKIEEKMEDPPFLNRFEKHVFSFEYLMNEVELKIASNINECLESILSFDKRKLIIDLRKQVPWYNSEEIKGLVAKECNEYDKKKENLIKYEVDILNDIWQIISKLLSQDIMAAIIFNENELNIKKDIKEYYIQNHLNNFNELFNSTKAIFSEGKNTKLIIYTFSKLLESVIKEKRPIMTSFGNLKRENIIERIVKSFKNDSDFDIIINDFYENSKEKLLIFKFNENDLDKINQIKFKINSIEIEKNKFRMKNLQEKHIIFIVCLTRQKIENKNKIRESTIDDLVSNIDKEYDQYFIDNLSGKIDSNIIETMSRSPSFYIEQLFNLKNNYLKNIFQKVFMFLAYQFKNINQNEQYYINEIIRTILKNDFLLNSLKNRLIKESGKTLNIFIQMIFSKGTFEKNDVEFLDIIFNSIYDKIYILIFKFIFRAENDHFLYPILFNYEFIKKEMILKQYIQRYIEKFDFNKINVVERIKSNQIILYLNLQLPLSKKWFYIIKIFIENNIKEDYLTNEDYIRFTFFKKEEILKELETYYKKKQDIINKAKGEILRIEGLNDLIESENIKYLKILYQDFMTLYLSQKFKDNFVLGLQFLDILIQLKLNIHKNDNYSFINSNNKIALVDSYFDLNKINIDNSFNQNIKYDVDTLTKILVFLISYSDEIYLMLEIFFSLNKYLENFYINWKNLIMRKEIKYEINKYNPEYTREFNEAFFIMYESLIKYIFIYNNYNEMQDSNFYEFLEAIKKILNDAKQIYLRLYLPSKEMYTLQILINIFNAYDLCKKKKQIGDLKKLFTQIKNNIISENVYIISKDYKNVEKNFNELISILNDLFDITINEKEYALLLNDLFLSRYNKTLDEEYRKLLIEMFFEKATNQQLKFIFPILKRLVSDITPKYLENEENDLSSFMTIFSFKEKDLNYFTYKIIVSKNNEILDLNLMFYFECEIELYFKKISNGRALSNIADEDLEEYSNDMVKNLSIKYFKGAIDYYLEERTLNELENEIKKVIKIYYLSYIKIYLKKVAELIIDNIGRNIFLNFRDIFEILLCKINDRNIYFLKIFLFKCIFRFANKNYSEFLESIKNEQNINMLLNHDEFGNSLFNTENKNKHCYNFSFIDIKNYEIYNYLSQIAEYPLENIEQHNQYYNISKFFNENKNNYNIIEIVYNVLINKYVFDLRGNRNANNNLAEEANSFIALVERMKINFQENSKKLINYLINKNEFQSKIITKLNLPSNIPLNEDLLYILFYCIKLVVSIQAIPNNIYSDFYSNNNNLIEALSNNYFPCSFPQANERIDSYNEIEAHLRNQPSNFGIYVCSCGKFYTILPCGFPTERSNCPKCGEKIGGVSHKLERRQGHFRIILDEQSKIEIIDNGHDRTMPYMLLRDYKSDIIDPLLNQPYKGIGKITKQIINKTDFTIRKINELNFRIVNLIIYSHLLIANILDILDNKKMSEYFSEETSCFDIMISNWNKIQELLNQIGINNIKIFMNIIFERIMLVLSKYDLKTITSQTGRNIIEQDFNKFINLDEIKSDILIYEQQNQQILNSSPFNLSSLIQQLYQFSVYQNKEPYSYLKYLYLYPLPKASEILTRINSNNAFKNKYPLTLKVLKYFEENDKDISLLGYLPKINKKLNHLIDNYSYKISRDEALKRTIKAEFNKGENNLFAISNLKHNNDAKQYIEDIINLFDDFKNIPLQWGCHQLKKMTINVDSSLCSILLDDNEPGYYLASIYKKLIEYQNTFLDNIINCNSQNGLLHCFVKQLKSEIMVQDVSSNEIVKFEIIDNEKNNNKLYSCLDEIIFVNISNEPFANKFNYELDQIEIELGNLFLPGLRKFKSKDDELRFITYMFEGYRGKKSHILTNFNEKYPPQELNPNEKSILNYFIGKFPHYEYKTFLFSIQILISYIQNSLSPNETSTSIYQVIMNIPEHYNIDDNIKELFRENQNIKINKTVRIFEFFEYLCWDQIKDNLLDEFMKPLNEEKILLIGDYYQNNKNNNISKAELAEAIRKFISRYLAGKRSQSEIGEDKMLFDYLPRVDLWKRNIDDPEFENEISKLKKLNITVGEAKDFYDKLGGDNKLFNSSFKNERNIQNNYDEKNANNVSGFKHIKKTVKIRFTKKKKEDKDFDDEKEEETVEKKNDNKETNNKNNNRKRKLF